MMCPNCKEFELDYQPAGNDWIITCSDCGYVTSEPMQCKICGGDYNEPCNEIANCLTITPR